MATTATQPTQIAAITYTIRDYLTNREDYAESMKKMKNIGFKAIQGAKPAFFTNEEFKDLLDENGLMLCSYGGNLDRMRGDFDALVEEIHYFGCTATMIGAIPVEYRDTEEGYYAFVKEFNMLAKKFADNGIDLMYHNHAQEFRRFKSGKRGIDIIFEGFDPLYTKFMLDTHWVHSGGDDVLKWIKKCEGRMHTLHCKDYMIDPDPSITDLGLAPKLFAEIGEGNLPWQQIVDTALSIGVKWFVIEQDFSRRNPFDSLAISIKGLQNVGLK